jgi:glycosyltransferase involved in cell wall biosynthesis
MALTDFAGGRRIHPSLRLLACSLDGIHTACGHLRLWGPLAHCPAVEVRKFRHVSFLEDLDWADLVVVQRGFPGPDRVRHFEAIHRSGIPLAYETDDPIHLMAEGHPDWKTLGPTIPHIRTLIDRADALILSTQALADLFPTHRSRHVVENALDEEVWPRCEIPDDRGPIRIVFSGTPSHRDDLAAVETALDALLRRHGENIQLFLMGCTIPSLESFPQVDRIPFTTDYATYARSLREMRPHIAIAPLLDTPFNRTKSAIKWLEMSACGAAGIYQDLAPYRSAVIEGETGILAASSPAAWMQAIERLVGDHDFRRTLARNAQREVWEKHLVSVRGPQLEDVLRGIVAEATASRGRRHRLGVVGRTRFLLDL